MADNYAYEAAKTSARALAGSAGFDVVQHSCLDILANLILRYIKEVGAASHHYAELAGRSETNPVDVVRRGPPRRTFGRKGT
jgi:transcription initiation factor TFIID subunit 8